MNNPRTMNYQQRQNRHRFPERSQSPMYWNNDSSNTRNNFGNRNGQNENNSYHGRQTRAQLMSWMANRNPWMYPPRF
ncbi:hypothetical protein GJ496_003067 [Pomphorhynchus laevis]|nr:hypothetical protein GJ496_003067 [Pomphorhynchus laevis]